MKKPDNPLICTYIEKWGNSSSIGLFDQSCQWFLLPEIEGVIGYRIEIGCAIVFGDPVCAPENLSIFIQKFSEFCNTKGITNILYVTASQQFTHKALENGFCSGTIRIGYEVILNPLIDPKNKQNSNGKLVRKKYNNAQRNGIIIKEYTGSDLITEQIFEEVKNAWLNNRTGVQLYLSSINLFAYRANKRYFYAEHNNKISSLLVLNRIKSGWTINTLMSLPSAPKSVSEALILHALDILRSEECFYFSAGFVTSAQETTIYGLNPFYTWLTLKTFNMASYFFKLDTRKLFWEKFEPEFSPTYITLQKPKIGIKETIGIIKAFNISLYK